MQLKKSKRYIFCFILLVTVIYIGNMVQLVFSPPAIPAPTCNSSSTNDVSVYIKLKRITYYRDKDAFSKGDMYVKWWVWSGDGSFSASGRLPKTGNVQVHKGQTKYWNFITPHWLQDKELRVFFKFQTYDADPGKDDAFPKAEGSFNLLLYAEGEVGTWGYSNRDCYYVVQCWWINP